MGLSLLALLFIAAVPPAMAEATAGRLEPSRDRLRRAAVGIESRYVLPESRAAFPVRIVPGAILNVGFGVDPRAWLNGLRDVRFTVAFNAGGERVVLFERVLGGADRRRWDDARIGLERVAGQVGELELIALPNAERPVPNDLIFWSVPRIDPEPRGSQPNFILVSIDTLRADHLGCYGYERDTSPNIDRLAGEGVLFRNAIASSSWTLPSHASMFTGLNPSGHGAVRFGRTTPLVDELDTLAELLWDSGYETGAFTGGGFVGKSHGFDQGFQSYQSPTRSEMSSQELVRKVEQSKEWIESVRARPFFLFLHTYQIHLPFNPQPPYDTMFDADYDGPFKAEFTGKDSRGSAAGSLLDDRTVEHLAALYDGEIRGMDENLNRLVRFLEESGLSHQTCLIVTSDHGEEFREHGDTFHHSAKLYEELVRIPLVVSCPTMFEGGRVIEYPVSLVDLLPTVLEIANIAVPPRLDGESLVPLLEGTGGLARQATVSEVDGSVNSKGGRAFAFRTERYKLIESTFAGTRELFDLQDDPAEERDISREKPRVVKRLIKIARAERRRRLRSTAPDTATPAEATLERLRALGYDL